MLHKKHSMQRSGPQQQISLTANLHTRWGLATSTQTFQNPRCSPDIRLPVSTNLWVIGVWLGRRFKKGFAEPSASSLPAEVLEGSSGPGSPGMNAGVAGAGPEGLLGDAPESQIKDG